MVQSVKWNLTREHGGYGLSLGYSFISSLSGSPCRGGFVTSDGGALLLRQADRRLGLTAAVARRLGIRVSAASGATIRLAACFARNTNTVIMNGFRPSACFTEATRPPSEVNGLHDRCRWTLPSEIRSGLRGNASIVLAHTGVGRYLPLAAKIAECPSRQSGQLPGYLLPPGPIR